MSALLGYENIFISQIHFWFILNDSQATKSYITVLLCSLLCTPGNKSEVWEDVICSRLPACRQPSQPSLLTPQPSFLPTNLCDKTMVKDESHVEG